MIDRKFRGAHVLAGGLLVWTGPMLAFAQDAKTYPAASPALPVRDVTLFSSGVSYTLRQGDVDGDASIPLTFRTSQINDILKSMVLLDTKGTVRPAIYAAKDPIGRTLQSFAVDVSQPTDRVALLNRLKGAEIAIEGGGTVIAASTATEKFSLQGQLVGVDKESANGFGYQGNILTLLGPSGLQSVKLDEIHSIRFLDERISREFRDALTLQASGSDNNRKQMTLHFDGSGRRKVSVGYVSEAPLWKITYRLLIGGTSGGAATEKPYLQGWALVENTTDEDWTNIRLSLVSGRPISFIQDLYQPLYLPRPIVPPDVVASPYPQLAESDVVTTTRGSVAKSSSQGGFGGGRGGGGGFGAALPEMAAAPPAMDAAAAVTAAAMANSVQAGASGQQVGELFQYSIAAPVTLPRQQAAMIPVVAQNVEGDKISLYNADTDPRFPLNGFRIRNNTPIHLKGGPITIFDDGIYAGDARVEDIPPGDSRLVTYAVDLAVVGERQGPNYSGVETSLALRHGVLVINRKERQTTKYNLTNKAQKRRLVIIEHPYDSTYKLVEPAAASSRTPTHYRFEVPLAAGKNDSLWVATEKLDSQTIALLDMEVPALQVYIGRGDVAAKVKDALREVVAQRAKVKTLKDQAAATEAEIASITQDQERIRKNMTELDRNSALYKRYVGQLDAQETKIQSVRAEAERLRAAIATAEQDLKTYVGSLDITP